MDVRIHEIIQENVENNTSFDQIIKEFGKLINNYSKKDIERLYKKYLDYNIRSNKLREYTLIMNLDINFKAWTNYWII